MGSETSQTALRKYLQYAEGNDQIPLSVRGPIGEDDHVKLSIGDMEVNYWKMPHITLAGEYISAEG